jgi:hypothetical protein
MMANRERLRIYLRRRQLVNETGNVVVQCNPDNTAQYVPGNVDTTWMEFTELTQGLDKLDLSWDNVNTGTSSQSTETSPGGSNYDKGISLALIFNDAAYEFINDWLLGSPCGILNSIEVMITDELCQKRYRNFEIKADNLTYEPYNAPCEFEIKLREADPVWHCIHKTFIWDNWQGWFIDGSSKQHPCFITAVEPRPRLINAARMGLSIFGRTIPLVSLIFNESDDAFRRIQGVDNFVDAPLIRDFISNVCDKCGITADTMFHDPDNPYYDACLYYPLSGAMHNSAASAATSPALWFHFENRWNITLAELLDKLKVIFQAEWYVTPGNTLVFKPKGDFIALSSSPIIDLTDQLIADKWDKLSLRYSFNGNKQPAYGRYQYQIDASDLASQEAQPLYNDIVDYDGPTDNLMLEGNISMSYEFASTGFVRDGRAQGDYLRQVVIDGETVAYALVVVLAIIIASLFAGTLSAGAGAVLAAFLGVWAALIAAKSNDLRDLFGGTAYTGAVRLTSEQVGTPRLLLWDGVSLNRAKVVSVDPDDIVPNTWFNTTSEDYTTRNKFNYTPVGGLSIFNYPFYFESFFLDNMYDRYMDALDNPLKSLDTHQRFEVDLSACCDFLDILGVWDTDFAKIGYFVKIESRAGYDVVGRIEHFNVNYDEEKIGLRGKVYKFKTP